MADHFYCRKGGRQCPVARRYRQFSSVNGPFVQFPEVSAFLIWGVARFRAFGFLDIVQELSFMN